MKIGLLSINAHTKVLNFASPLHTYVFQDFLRDNGIDSTIIDYKAIYYGKFDVKHPLFYYIDHPNPDLKKQKENLKKWKDLFYERETRYDRIEEFIQEYYKKTDKCYSAKSMETEDAGFDCYICVTDVIWKHYPKKGFDKGYFLAAKTMEGKKKIAYAASKGPTIYTPEQGKEFLKYISDFDYISVRESSLQEYIKDISGLDVPHVIDPVFLKDIEFYENLLIKPNRKKGYVLIYLAMEKNIDLITDAVRFAEIHNLDVIELSENMEDANIPKGTHHDVIYGHGIEEWLGYMRESEYIFTNSFHACCFSIIFEKQFFAGSRAGDKIDSVLEMFGLSWRRIGKIAKRNSKEIKEDIDYSKIKPILDKYVKESSEYILNAIREIELRPHRPVQIDQSKIKNIKSKKYSIKNRQLKSSIIRILKKMNMYNLAKSVYKRLKK